MLSDFSLIIIPFLVNRFIIESPFSELWQFCVEKVFSVFVMTIVTGNELTDANRIDKLGRLTALVIYSRRCATRAARLSRRVARSVLLRVALNQPVTSRLGLSSVFAGNIVIISD